MPDQEDIDRLIEKISRLLPSVKPHLTNILASYAGVRALPGSAKNTYRASREVAICDHRLDGVEGFHSVFGGKWTTARHIAEQVVDQLVPFVKKVSRPCDTRTAQIAKRPIATTLAGRLQYAASEEMAVTREDYFRRLGRTYFIAQPETRQEVETWLASNQIGSDNKTGHDIAGER